MVSRARTPKPTSTNMNIIQAFDAHRQPKHAFRFASKLMASMAIGTFAAMTFSAVHAQATASRIVGKAPTDGTVTVHSDTGMTRHGTANSKGRYAISSLQPGTYMVSFERDGKKLASLSGVPLFVGVASEVDFKCDKDQCTASFGR